MFASRDTLSGASGTIEVAFTDRFGGVSPPPYDSLDLRRVRDGGAGDVHPNVKRLAAAFGVDGFATMRQVQGADVAEVEFLGDVQPTADALVTSTADLALCVRVGDCVPVVLADAESGAMAVAHAGREGVVQGVVPATVSAMRTLGAEDVVGWIGPHVCGACYEVPAGMRREVSAVVPAAFGCTAQGTPSVDLGAAVAAQLRAEGCAVVDRSACTVECTDFYSYRRDGAGSGRFAGVVVRRAVAAAAADGR